MLVNLGPQDARLLDLRIVDEVRRPTGAARRHRLKLSEPWTAGAVRE
jgi:hypothetical protein